MRPLWADEPDHDLTEAELRAQYDLAHDPCPEQPEHERLAPYADDLDSHTGGAS